MFRPDPSLDLVLTRKTHVPVELVWKALVTSELLMQWFCPQPWKVSECSIDLGPGGRFDIVMESPEGEGQKDKYMDKGANTIKVKSAK